MKDEPILVKSFSELKPGLRVLIKNCRMCGKDKVVILTKIIDTNCMISKNRQRSFQYQPICNTGIHENCKPGCIAQGRLFKFIDFDENSEEEKTIVKNNNKLENYTEVKKTLEKVEK